MEDVDVSRKREPPTSPDSPTVDMHQLRDHRQAVCHVSRTGGTQDLHHIEILGGSVKLHKQPLCLMFLLGSCSHIKCSANASVNKNIGKSCKNVNEKIVGIWLHYLPFFSTCCPLLVKVVFSRS